MTFSTRIIQGPVGRLAVTTAGEGGLPVLFVHGHGGSRKQWAAWQTHLGQRTVSFDLRGMGESEPDPAGRSHVQDFVEDVGAVAEGLGLRSFVLVGQGFGAGVAGEYAVRHPGRVAGLVLVEPGESAMDPREHLSRYPGPARVLPSADLLAQLEEFLAEVEEHVALEDMSPPGPTDATGALTLA